MLEAVERELCLLDVMHCMLRRILEAVEGGLCLRKVVEVPEVMRCCYSVRWRCWMLDVLELMCRVLLCMLESVEGELCLVEVAEVMRSVLLRMLEAVGRWALFAGGVGGAGNALCAIVEGSVCGRR